MRPKQWVKNTFVLAPLVFVRAYLDADAVGNALIAFVLFCIASSASYIVNDLRDIERDRRHPTKRLSRPLAAGIVSKTAAFVLLGVLYGLLALGLLVQPNTVLVILGYLALNLLYTYWLKDQPVLDLFAIAVGFVLRVYAGAVALSVPLSSWMAITTLCLALYLAAIKRRQELSNRGTDAREVLARYSISLIDRYAEMSATGALVFYSLFVISSNQKLVVTIPLVIFGLFRYWYVIEQHNEGESPTDLVMTDIPLAATVLAWAGACVWALWP
ncbi:MAG: decaprenyl-phosphate phosphoribosyltransferase [Alphaproteobacteria bacterium]|nr:decaprenyl-phosphate phosphoribosyltransferase [Alphaproteobacteria bacterium]